MRTAIYDVSEPSSSGPACAVPMANQILTNCLNIIVQVHRLSGLRQLSKVF